MVPAHLRRDLGSDLPRADVETIVGLPNPMSKWALNQTGLPALVKDALGSPALTIVVRPALHSAPPIVGETIALPDVSGTKQTMSAGWQNQSRS